jgi:hypothetical protein
MNEIIKMALENVVLCRGAHSAKESYEYATRMEKVIKHAIEQRLLESLGKDDIRRDIQRVIDQLNE